MRFGGIGAICYLVVVVAVRSVQSGCGSRSRMEGATQHSWTHVSKDACTASHDGTNTLLRAYQQLAEKLPSGQLLQIDKVRPAFLTPQHSGIHSTPLGAPWVASGIPIKF